MSDCFCNDGYYDTLSRPDSFNFSVGDKNWESLVGNESSISELSPSHNEDKLQESVDYLIAENTSGPLCRLCPNHTVCGTKASKFQNNVTGATAKSLLAEFGHWRAAQNTDVFHPCPYPAACIGGAFMSSVSVRVTMVASVKTQDLEKVLGLKLGEFWKEMEAGGEGDSKRSLTEYRHLNFVILDSQVAAVSTILLRAMNKTVQSFAVQTSVDRDRQCRKGHRGLLCRNCETEDGYATGFLSQSCEKCQDGDGSKALLALLAGVTGLIVLFFVLRKYFDHHSLNKMMSKRNMPFKILIGFVQVCSTIPDNFRLVYPPAVMQLFRKMKYLNIFDVFSFAANLGCLFVPDYYSVLLVKVLGPISVLVFMFIVCAAAKSGWFDGSIATKLGRLSRNSSLRFSRTSSLTNISSDVSNFTKADAISNAALVFSFVVYTGVVTTLIQFFDCRQYEDGVKYLVVDPSVLCDDNQYQALKVPVWLFTVIISVGFPFYYYKVLRSQRFQIKPLVIGALAEMGRNMAAYNQKCQAVSKQKEIEGKKGTAGKSRAADDGKAIAIEVQGTNNQASSSDRNDDRLPNGATDSSHRGFVHGVVRVLPEREREILTCTEPEECEKIIQAAFDVQRKLLDPTQATWWLQEIYRCDDTTILHTKFLWGM
jgi:hypothetical protein